MHKINCSGAGLRELGSSGRNQLAAIFTQMKCVLSKDLIAECNFS